MSRTNGETLLELLHAHGTLGNGKARELLQWSEAQYEVAKGSSVAKGKVAMDQKDEKLGQIDKQLKALQDLFRTLLHELMTGKVRVQ